MQHQKAVGRRIRLAREALGIKTVRELAQILGIGDSTWYNYELGLRPVNHFAVHRFATRYDISLDYVFSGKKEKLRHDILLEIERIEAEEAKTRKPD